MKKHKIIFWVATSIIFLLEGLVPLGTLIFAPEYFNVGTKPLGYPDYFAYALIIFKVLGATAIILPPPLPDRLKEWAYAGLTFTLIFALLSHIIVDKNIGYILMPVAVGAILALSYISYHKINDPSI